MSVLFEERSSSLERRWKAAWSALERNMSVLKLFYISFIFILNAYKNVCSEVCFSHGWFLWCVLGMFFASHLASGLLTSSLWIVFLLEVGWRLRENWLFSSPLCRWFFHHLKPLHGSFWFSICPFWRKLQFLRNEGKKDSLILPALYHYMFSFLLMRPGQVWDVLLHRTRITDEYSCKNCYW